MYNNTDATLRPDGGGIYGAKSTAAYLASVGEPLLTGWSQRQADAIATREGLVLVSDIGRVSADHARASAVGAATPH